MKVNKKTNSAGAADRNMRKRIQCPKCKSRIFDTPISTVTEIRILSKDTETRADFYVKCSNCNTEIAIKKLG